MEFYEEITQANVINVNIKNDSDTEWSGLDLQNQRELVRFQPESLMEN